MARVTRKLTVINEMGIHARPATQIVELTNTFQAKITFQKLEEEVDGKSIFGVMMLAAVKGTELLLAAEGEDAEDAIEAVEKLFVSGFGELASSGEPT